MVSKTNRIGTVVGLLLMAGSICVQPASGHEANPKPTAILKLFSKAPGTLEWRGNRDAAFSKRFCVASSTGHFEIIVASSSNTGLLGEPPLSYEVTIELNGVVRRGTLSQQTPSLRLQGMGDRSHDCSAASAGTLTVRLLQQDAFGAVAGAYQDQLTVSVNPI